jgi:hypothetical protein
MVSIWNQINLIELSEMYLLVDLASAQGLY